MRMRLPSKGGGPWDRLGGQVWELAGRIPEALRHRCLVKCLRVTANVSASPFDQRRHNDVEPIAEVARHAHTHESLGTDIPRALYSTYAS